MLIPRLKGLKKQWQLLLALKEACSKNKMLQKMTATLTTDPCLKNYRNEIELKGVQFPGQGAPDKINRGG